MLDLELTRMRPPGPGDDRPDAHVAAISTTTMARNGHHVLLTDQGAEPFVDDKGRATMILLLAKPTLIPGEPRDSATEAPRSPLEPAEAATARVVMPPVDAGVAAEDEGVQVLLEFIISEVQSSVTLDRNMAEDIRSLLWEIYATQPEGPGRPVYVPSVKGLQRPLSEVLDEYFIKPELSGPGLRMLTDMLNVRRLARTLTSPRILTPIGQPARLTFGEWHDAEVVGNAITPGSFNFELEVTPTLSDDPSVLSLDTTLQLKDVIVEDGRKRLEAESMSLRKTSTAPDGEYHLCVGSGFERNDEEGHPCTLLVLAKATVLRDSALPRAADDILRPPTDIRNYLVDAYVARVQADSRLDPNTAGEVADLVGLSGPLSSSLTDRTALADYTVERFLREAGRNVPGETFQSIVRLLDTKGYVYLEAHPHMAGRGGFPNELSVVHHETTPPEAEDTAVEGVRLTVTCHALADEDAAKLDIECVLTEPTPSGDVGRRAIHTTAVLPSDRYAVIPIPCRGEKSDEPAIYLIIRQRQPEQSKTAPTPRPVTIDRGTDLLEALTLISEGTATPVAADASVRTQPVAVGWVGVSPEGALDAILADTPYTFEKDSTGYLVYRPITKAFPGVELRQALAELGRAAAVPITVVGPQAKGEIYATLANVPIEAALEMLLAGTPYVARHTGDGYVVTHRSTWVDTSVDDARIDELAKRIAQIEVDLIADQEKFTPNHPEIVWRRQLLGAYERKLAESNTARTPRAVNDATAAELAKRIAQLEADLIADQQKFAPNHPEIVQKKQLLAAYEEQFAEIR
jgi:hypothetical protein